MNQVSAIHMLICSQEAFVKVAIFRIFFQIHDFAKRLTRAKYGLLRPSLRDRRVL